MRRSNNAADALRVQLLFAVRTTPSFILEPYCPQLTSSFTSNEFLLVCSHLSNLNFLQPVHTGGGGVVDPGSRNKLCQLPSTGVFRCVLSSNKGATHWNFAHFPHSDCIKKLVLCTLHTLRIRLIPGRPCPQALRLGSRLRPVTSAHLPEPAARRAGRRERGSGQSNSADNTTR